MVGASHPTIFKFIEGLKQQQGLTDLKLEQILADNTQPTGRKKYKIAA